MAVQETDGKIVAAGDDGSGDFLLLRYNATGTLDSTFGSGGKVLTDLGGFDTPYAIAIQENGFDFALARYFGAANTPVGTNASVTLVASPSTSRT